MTADDREGLRSLIREVIRDVLPELGLSPQPQTVVVSNDDQLNGFVATLIAMLDDPTTGPLVRSGQLRFCLETEVVTPSETARAVSEAATGAADIEIERGALTERTVERAISDGARLVLGGAVVITPLARERIRKSGVTVVYRS